MALTKLRGARHFVAADIFCDERGIAFLTGAKLRTVRGWRSRKVGPPSIASARWLYDVAHLVEWLNAGGFLATGCGELPPVTSSDIDAARSVRKNQATV
jgi:hypothetical protein